MTDMKMGRLKLTGVMAGVIALSGCVQSIPIETPPVIPAYKSASRGLEANSLVATEVRAFSKESGKKAELKGVPCTIKSSYFDAEVITPAMVQLPSYADKTPPVELSCTYNEKIVTRTVAPYNQTVSDRTTKWGGGLLTYVIVAAATKAEKSVFVYPRLSVIFE